MFSGKTVVITGSSSGIGADAAEEFAKEKANLVLHGRNEVSLEGVKKECLSIGSPEVIYVLGDITDETVQQNLLQTALDRFEKIDVLINSAGTVLDTSVENFDIKIFDSVFDVNFRSAVSLTMKCVPFLKISQGSVVNVSSIVAIRPSKSLMAYCISKAALDGFTKVLAADMVVLLHKILQRSPPARLYEAMYKIVILQLEILYAITNGDFVDFDQELASDGVRVNSVNPGPIPTNIWRNNEQIHKDKVPNVRVPLMRYGTTGETSQAILFLASNKASYTTGNIFMVDGGMSLSTIDIEPGPVGTCFR